MITGAAGLVGRALAREFAADDVFPLSRSDLDVTDSIAVAATVERIEPDLIFNCAVIGVDDCERDPALAHRVNVEGPLHLAMSAGGAALVHFSSNYVFGGERRSPSYTIDDAPVPVNAYGRTKLEGELAAAANHPRTFIVRTSWVFGEGKASFLSTAPAKLRRGERIEAIRDVWASTTFVEDLVSRVREIVRRGVYGTFHVVNEGDCSYETFAREAASLVGVSESDAHRLIVSVTEAEMGRLAPRPVWTPMACLLSQRLGFAPMRRWQQALAAYVGS